MNSDKDSSSELVSAIRIAKIWTTAVCVLKNYMKRPSVVQFAELS